MFDENLKRKDKGASNKRKNLRVHAAEEKQLLMYKITAY